MAADYSKPRKARPRGSCRPAQLTLTATPDQTDQSDILSLCDDNLEFTRSCSKVSRHGC